MRLTSHLKIFNKEINVVTNSLLIKKFIDNGFYSFQKNKTNSLIDIPYILKDPYDIQEALSSILKLIGSFFKEMQNKYWIFHATAFSQDSQATVILGDVGSGKSSLCFAAGLLGAKVVSDEPVLIDKKSYLIIPFRYLIKIENGYNNFKKWHFFSKHDFIKNRCIKRGYFDFNLFDKKELNKLGIEVEYRKVSLKNIVFLEDKKYDSAFHLLRHCLNVRYDPIILLRSLNNLIKGKFINFIPKINKNLHNEKAIKNILKRIGYTPN